MPIKTYDPKSVIITVGGVPMQGFADGTFVTVNRLNDSYSRHAGADGEVARAKSNDRRGEMTLTLAQTSLSNDILSGILVLDEKRNRGVVPIAVKDLSGTTTFFSGTGWIRKPPDSPFGKEIDNREWVFDLAEVDVFIGGVLFA